MQFQFDTFSQFIEKECFEEKNITIYDTDTVTYDTLLANTDF